MTTSIRLAVLLPALAALAATAGAQGLASSERVSFPVANAFERGATVVGELRIPESQRERLPAVVIVNSSPGFDGRGAFYAEALNRAGIATFEIDMFQGKGIPASAWHNMPHAYQALRYLARHPRIDAARIGIMGFSWGAIIAVLASSDELARRHGSGNLRFAAHLAMYPQCWLLRGLLAGNDKTLQPSTLKGIAGMPVHILAGGMDDYDDADGCAQFVAQLPASVRAHYAVTVYEGATFAWDSRFSSATYSAGANKGKGGIVNVVADPVIADRSRAFAVEFFRRQLSVS